MDKFFGRLVGFFIAMMFIGYCGMGLMIDPTYATEAAIDQAVGSFNTFWVPFAFFVALFSTIFINPEAEEK